MRRTRLFAVAVLGAATLSGCSTLVELYSPDPAVRALGVAMRAYDGPVRGEDEVAVLRPQYPLGVSEVGALDRQQLDARWREDVADALGEDAHEAPESPLHSGRVELPPGGCRVVIVGGGQHPGVVVGGRWEFRFEVEPGHRYEVTYSAGQARTATHVERIMKLREVEVRLVDRTSGETIAVRGSG